MVGRNPIRIVCRTRLHCRVFGRHSGTCCFGFLDCPGSSGGRLALLRQVRSNPDTIHGIQDNQKETRQEDIEEETGEMRHLVR